MPAMLLLAVFTENASSPQSTWSKIRLPFKQTRAMASRGSREGTRILVINMPTLELDT